MGIGTASGVITDGSETLGLGNWELKLGGGTFGTADRSGANKSGSNE